jgi:hypothetical protein
LETAVADVAAAVLILGRACPAQHLTVPGVQTIMPSPRFTLAARRLSITTRFRGLAAVAALTTALLAAALLAGVPSSQASPRPASLRAQASLRLASLARAASATGPLTPSQIRSAYALPATGASGQKIAIISAYNDPYAQSDLNAYDKQYGLPACNAGNGCLRTLNEKGQAAPLPPTDVTGGTWITESAIGTEIAHGVCESCKIILVEASTTAKADFSAAVKAAGGAGATVIVTTFTAIEDPLDSQYLDDYSHTKAAVVSSVGDGVGQYGYSGEADFPASLPDVLAVGGTQLSLGRRGAYAGEQVWNDTLSGCSLYEPAPSWQLADAAAVGCQNRRAVADIAAEAEPGAIVHITDSGSPGGPWFAATGTSLSAPIIGAVVGLAGSLGSNEARTLYARAKSDPGAFHDITTGMNAPNCQSSICKARPGYDGPTGLGTPFGLAAFLPSGGALNRKHSGVTVSAPSHGLKAGNQWQVKLTVANGNPFAVSGSLDLQRTLRVSGRLTLVKFTTVKLKMDPLATQAETLTISSRYRSLLKSLGRVVVYARWQIRGPAGRAVTVMKSLALSAP